MSAVNLLLESGATGSIWQKSSRQFEWSHPTGIDGVCSTFQRATKSLEEADKSYIAQTAQELDATALTNRLLALAKTVESRCPVKPQWPDAAYSITLTGREIAELRAVIAKATGRRQP